MSEPREMRVRGQSPLTQFVSCMYWQEQRLNEAVKHPIPGPGRVGLSVQDLLAEYYLGDGFSPHVIWFQSALDEARKDSTAKVLAELLSGAYEAHDKLLQVAHDYSKGKATASDFDVARTVQTTTIEPLMKYAKPVGAPEKVSGRADKKTDNGKENEIKLPPNDVNNAARYISEQRKLIKEGRRPKAGKKALIEEHVVDSDPKKINRLAKELQPSRYGYLLNIGK